VAIAQLKLDRGDSEEAIRYARQASCIEPAVESARLILGTAYTSKKDFKNAIAELEEFVQSQPDNAEGQCRLGFAYLGAENYSQAEQKFKAALKADHNSVDALRGLTNLYQTQKKSNKAVSRLKREPIDAKQIKTL
jgi:Tfp pilus assembly protein PilF